MNTAFCHRQGMTIVTIHTLPRVGETVKMLYMARILSLDDETAVLNLLQRMLEGAGYEFLGTTDEQIALSILREQSIDLFTQDFMRPGTGGVEFLRQIKSDTTINQIPILGISAGTKETRAEQLKQVGLDINHDLAGYLQKPFRPETLINKVANILQNPG